MGATQIRRSPRPPLTGASPARPARTHPKKSPRITRAPPRAERRQPSAHRIVEVPVDPARVARRLVGVAPAEKQATLLELPIEPGADIEDHRQALDVECRVWLEHRDAVSCGTDRDPNAGE